MKDRFSLDRRSFLVALPVLASLPSGLLASKPARGIDAAEPDFYQAQTSWPVEPLHTPAVEGWIDVGGAELWYQDSGGSGVPIVLLHASTGSAAAWRYQQDRFSRAGYRVIAYSRRGYFRSKTGESAKLVSGAADLLVLSEKLQLARFHLIGTAAGGFIAMDFALSYPERVRSLVIASSLGGIDEPEFVQAYRRLLTPEFLALPHDVKELGPAYRALNPAGTARWNEIEKAASEGSRALPPKQNVISWQALRGLRPPAMFLTGAADLYMPPSFFTMIRRQLPNARYVVIAEAGHSTSWEQLEAFNAAVLSFLARR